MLFYLLLEDTDCPFKTEKHTVEYLLSQEREKLCLVMPTLKVPVAFTSPLNS
jgi:hypothetical protein